MTSPNGEQVGRGFIQLDYDVETAAALSKVKSFQKAAEAASRDIHSRVQVDTSRALAEMGVFRREAERAGRFTVTPDVDSSAMLRRSAEFRAIGDRLGREFTDAHRKRVQALGDQIAADTVANRKVEDAYRTQGDRAARAFTHEMDKVFKNAVRDGTMTVRPDVDRRGFLSRLRGLFSGGDVDVDRHSNHWGQIIGHNLKGAFEGVLSLLPSRLESVFIRTGPVIGTALAAAIGGGLAVTLPAIIAGIAGAAFATLGIGAIAAGILLVKDDPRVTSAADQVSKAFHDRIWNSRGAEAMVRATVGALNMLRDNINQWAPVISGIFEHAAQMFEKLSIGFNGMIDAIMPALGRLFASGFMQDLAQLMSESLRKIGEAISDFINRILDDPEALQGIKLAFEDLLNLIPSLIRLLGDVIIWAGKTWAKFNNDPDGAGPAISTLETIKQHWEDFRNSIQPVIDLLGIVLGLLTQIGQQSFSKSVTPEDVKNKGGGLQGALGNAGKMSGVTGRSFGDEMKMFGDAAKATREGGLGKGIESLKASGIADDIGKLAPAFNLAMIAGNKFKGWWDTFVQGFKAVWNGAIEDLKGAWNGLISFLKMAWTNFTTALSTIWNTGYASFKVAWDNAWNLVRTTVQIAWNAITMVVQTAITVISTIISTTMSVIGTIISGGLNIIMSIWNAVWGTIQAVTQGVWDAIMGLINIAINFVANLISATLDFIQNIWASVWQGIVNFVGAVWQLIVDIVRGNFDAVWQDIQNILNAIADFWANIWQNIVDFVSQVWDGIRNVVNEAIQWVSDVIHTTLDTIHSKWNEMWNAISSILGDVWEGIKGKVSDGIQSMITILNSGISAINAVLDKLGVGFKIDPISFSGPVVNSGGQRSAGGNFAEGGRIQQLASGGRVRGPGGPTEDKVATRMRGSIGGRGPNVSPDEYVINASASRRIGYNMLNYLNRHAKFPPGYAGGGQIGLAGGGSIGDAINAASAAASRASGRRKVVWKGASGDNEGLMNEHRDHVHVAMAVPPMGFQAIIELAKRSGIPNNPGSTFRPGSRGSGGGLDHHSEGRAVDFMGFNQDALAMFFAQQPGTIELIHRSNTGDYGIFGGKGSMLNEFLAKGIDFVMNQMLGPELDKVRNQLPNTGIGALGKAVVGDKMKAALKKKIEEVIAAMSAGVAGAAGPISTAAGSVTQKALAQAKLMGATRDELIALFEAGIVESGFANSSVMTDHDSVGFLQQRPSQGWGSIAQIMDPAFATRSFLSRIKGTTGTPGQRAQQVQRSAFPAKYDAAQSQAISILKSLGVPGFDNGGMLPPGISTVMNGTGKPERVLADHQWDALTSDGDTHIEVYINGVKDPDAEIRIKKNNKDITDTLKRGRG